MIHLLELYLMVKENEVQPNIDVQNVSGVVMREIHIKNISIKKGEKRR